MSRLLELFRPREFAASVSDIDPVALREKGFSSILLDLDNTLLPWKDSVVPDEIVRWIDRTKAAGMRPCIVSNTHNPGRLNKIAEELGIPCVFRALKPRRHGFRRAAQMLECESSTAVVVGDQLLTDILGGNLCGMHTILVKPMHRREFIGTKISRLVERGLLALLARGAPGGTNPERFQSQTQDTK